MHFSETLLGCRIKEFFFSSPNDGAHNELYIYPPILTAVLRGCVRGQTVLRDDCCESL